MEIQNTQSLIERFNTWLRESISVKLTSIGFLALILLVPSSWISSLMDERQQRVVIAERPRRRNGRKHH